MTIARWLDPSGCPVERPSLPAMNASTRSLHGDIDDRIRRTGTPSLHPEHDTILEDLFGSPRMTEWQDAKGLLAFTGEACWSDLPPIYARYGSHPTRRLLAALRTLEGAAGAIAADSGMGALALTIDALLVPGAHAILWGQVYNKTQRYLEWALARLGGTLTVIGDDDGDRLLDAVRPETRLVLAETFTNPRLRARDLSQLRHAGTAGRAIAADLRVVLDTTIATPWGTIEPVLSIPGIDVIAASGTKALGGQDTDLWGYVATNDVRLANSVMDLQAMRGGVLDSRRAAVIADGLPAAEARHARRCASATRIAAFLDAHPRVEEVFHPSLPTHPDAEAIRAHYQRHASLLSFRVVDASDDATRHLADALATCVIVRYALSFDGLVTKVNHHTTVSEYYTPGPVLRKAGLDRLIRLGLGTEDPDDVIACLNWTLWHGADATPESLEAWRTERAAELGLRG